MTTEKYCRQTVRGRIVDFFSDNSVNRYNAFKWGGLLLLASVLLPLILSTGCVDIGAGPTIVAPRYSEAGDVILTGLSVPGSYVEILDGDGNRLGTAAAQQNTGVWITTDPIPFEAGEHDLSVRIISRLRDQFNPESPLVLLEDPEMGSSQLTVYDLPTFDLPSEEVNAGLVALAGAGTAGTLMKLFANGEELGEVEVGPNGEWSFDASLPDDGEYEITAEVVDPDGNVLSSVPGDTLSVVSPIVPLVAFGRPEAADTFTTTDGTTASGPLEWSGTGTRGATIELLANGAVIGETTVNENSSWMFDGVDSNLNLGTNIVSVRMLNEDGEVIGGPLTDTLRLGLDSDFVVDGRSFEFAAEGTPSLGDFTTSDGENASGSISWSGTGNPGETVELWINGVKVGETTVDENGNWSFADFGSDMVIGDNTVAVQMVDADGNVTGEAISQAVALSASQVTDASGAGGDDDSDDGDGDGDDAGSVGGVTLDSADFDPDTGLSTLSGTAEPGSIVTLFVNGVAIGTVEADADGNWSLEGYFPDGDHTIKAAVIDADGNPSAESDEVALSVSGNSGDDLAPSADGALIKVISRSEAQAREDGTFDDRFLSGSAAISMILDASWSMTLPTDSDDEADRLGIGNPNNRINIAKAEMIELVNNTIPEGTPIALRSLGNRGGNLACVTALEYPLQGMDRDSLAAAIDDIIPGFNTNTPLADTLSFVPQDLADAGDRERVVVLLTDGEEKCGGDVDAVIDDLVNQGISLRLNIIGFAINDDAVRDKLQGWATAGNGFYFDASDASALSDALTSSLASVFQLVDVDGQTVATGVVGADAVEVEPGIYTMRITSVDGFETRTVVVPAETAVQVTID
ncbi:MAG: Ig-like domain-containing protein [Chloroflexota bacterium]